jgi:hypothetical protein
MRNPQPGSVPPRPGDERFRREVPLNAQVSPPVEYAGPTGRERPGEHWNARAIRETAETELNLKLGGLETIRVCLWCLKQGHFGPGPAGVQTCGVLGCECWCTPTED